MTLVAYLTDAGVRRIKIFSVAFCSLLATASALPLSAYSQGLPLLDFSGRSGDKRPELLDEKIEPAPPALTTPAPSPAPIPIPKKPTDDLLKSVLVKKIEVTGSSVFTAEEFAKVTAPYENRTLTMEDLESVRRDLTLLYVNKGYINSGAVLPDQTVTAGVITFKVIEGKLSHIEVVGNKWFGSSYIRDRVARGADSPVNIIPLQDRLQLLQQDARIQRVHAELRPGGQPGEGNLTVRVEEKPPFSVWVAFNNYQSPSDGAERVITTVSHQNLSGHGDVLSLTYGYSEGLRLMLDTWYSLPLNSSDTTLLLRYRTNDTKVVDKMFSQLDIKSETDTFEITLRQPIYRTLNQEFALSLGLEHENSTTSLAGEWFNFSPGVKEGHARVVPLRFSQEWTYRSQQQVLAARSRFSYGLDIMGATDNSALPGDLPSGKFFAWLGQLQWARILDVADIQLISRLDVQRSNDPLLPAEQMGVGGRYTVRGYRENYLVRDEALVASVEARIPLVQNRSWADYLQLAPFFDYGSAKNVGATATVSTDISSCGLGLRWGATPLKGAFELKLEAEVYAGARLKTVAHTHDDLQDEGIHFQFAVSGNF
jgi:hemolysin activation/secretion protein